MRRCNDCQEVKESNEFHKNKRTRDGICHTCKKCMCKRSRAWHFQNPDKSSERTKRFRKQNPDYDQQWREKNPEKVRNIWLKQYGITQEFFERMLFEQEGRCAICEKIMEKPCVDHCHKSGKVRGLLCWHCNAALGLLKDSTKNLKNAILYLERTSA